jgi:DNA polymerase III subunit epsilon
MSVIVIDLETTGLDTRKAKITEVAAVDMHNADNQMYFVPQHPVFSTVKDGVGLGVSRYFERGVYQDMLSVDGTTTAFVDLHKMLQGNTVAGSNPRFDTNLLARTFAFMNMDPEPWHHRLLDLSAYAAGVFGLPFSELPGLNKVCQMLGVDQLGEHSAMGDVLTTMECFERLDQRAGFDSK